MRAEEKFDISVLLYHSINMRATLTIADDVYKAAKILAEGSGKLLGTVVSELARRGLCTHIVQPGDDNLPAFSVPVDAEVIPGNRARELLAEDDVE